MIASRLVVDRSHSLRHQGDPWPSHRAQDIAFFFLIGSWPLIGLFGHEPWKPDEAYTFGLVYSFLQGDEMLVPMLAGSYFMEKPPLFYWFATSSAYTFGSLLSLPDAARIAVALFVYPTLGFLAATGRVLFGHARMWVAPTLYISALGLFDKVHLLVTDVGLLCGLSIGFFGLVLAPRAPLGAGLAMGCGGAIAFMCKGLLGPGILAVAALAVLLRREYRNLVVARSYAIGTGIGIPLMLVWPASLYARSPQLFGEWLWVNNFGRYFGFVRLGHRQGIWFYPVTLLWLSFPLWPLAAHALWRARQNATLRHVLYVPGCAFVGTLVVLMGSTDARTLYALPLLLPLSLVAAPGLDAIPDRVTRVPQIVIACLAALIVATLWLGWLAALAGSPGWLAKAIVHWAPGFEMPFVPLALAVALLGTLAWALATKLRPAGPEAWLRNWAAGFTVAWLLAMTLWLPALDYVKSYRTEMASLAHALPSDVRCVAGLRLGEPVRAMLHYYLDLITRNAATDPSAESCEYLIVQIKQGDAEPQSTVGLQEVWHGQRPGDQTESLALYRRR